MNYHLVMIVSTSPFRGLVLACMNDPLVLVVSPLKASTQFG